MSNQNLKDLANHRLEQAKEELDDAKLLYRNNSYLSANNRAYYSIFHSIKALISLEPIDFKKHNEVIAYFNKNYVRTEFFSEALGKRIMQAKSICEDGDYGDEFIASQEVTENQIATAEELIKLVEEYIKNK